ncbi:hypothetical protein TWF718_007630 [Orbilia javanica]|uniref:F-box domain-containing protein n=1 Tax=Orbilia javanica TaxID=47235 RepID=A0AAN8N0W9_9PEZI
MPYSKPCPSIITLPTEIQLEIFSYLTDMNSQSSIYGTCTFWRRMLSEHTMLRAARYYRGRAPYIYFPVVHRFFDISPRGNGRCQIRDGAIINYQYKTDIFGYMDVSGMVKNDAIFSPVCGTGWWAPRRQGTTVDSKSIWSQDVVKTGNGTAIGHAAYKDEQDAGGELSITSNVGITVDDNNTSDAIWIHIQIGHKYERENNGDPSFSAWERVSLPKNSTIENWTNAFLEAVQLLLHQRGESKVADFDMDFREAFVSGSKPMEGWYLDIWVILPENLEDRLVRLEDDIRDIQRDHGLVIVAFV